MSLDRADPALYPHSIEITSRVSDIDGLGHLNAVAIARFYEESRASLYAELAGGLRAATRLRTVVAELTIRYLAEGFYPGTLIVGAGVLKIGRTSYVLGQALFQDGRCIGTADTVTVNMVDGSPAPLPEFFRLQLDGLRLKARVSDPAE
jgi:acyl-CoA thioester hydrolase